MNLGEIKRFVNDGLQPLNKLIGTYTDGEQINTLFGQQKIQIDLDGIKEQTGKISSIQSTVNSILSKINNLGSKKIYGFSSTYIQVEAYNYISLSGAGLVIISNTTNGQVQCFLSNKSFRLAQNSVVAIPLKKSEEFYHNYTGGYVSIIWCPLS